MGRPPKKATTKKGTLTKQNKSGITTTQVKKEINNIKAVEPEEDDFYKCCCCGKKYTKQKGNFSFSQSPMFNGNHNFLPICNNCLENLIEQYTELLGSQDEAIRRVCLHWDYYLSEKILATSRKTGADRSRIKTYVRNCNLAQHTGKTYDTYLREMSKTTVDSIQDLDDIKENREVKVSQKSVKFFGLGYTPEQYLYLQNQYEDWTHRHVCETKAQEELFKNLCIAQLNINIAQQNGGKVSEAMKTFQDLLGSANLKPTQTNDNALADTNTFGTLIKKWENEKPIPDPDPEWKDVDNIIRYISIYFLGHLCKMMGIKNRYSKMYEDEMAKYRVQKPEYEGDDEAIFDAIFNGDSYGNEDE